MEGRIEKQGQQENRGEKSDLWERFIQKFGGAETFKQLDFSDKEMGSLNLDVTHGPVGTLTINVHGENVRGSVMYVVQAGGIEVANTLRGADDRTELKDKLGLQERIEAFLFGGE